MEKKDLDFTGYNIPEHTKSALNRYHQQGSIPGGFLQAVFRNDLFSSVARADAENLSALKDIVFFVQHNMVIMPEDRL